ncbi:hypothetical protein RYX36_011201, partial [Vicia faba]
MIVNPLNGCINYDKLEEKLADYRPKFLICGHSSYPRECAYGRFRKIVDKCEVILMCDVALISGLVAAKEVDCHLITVILLPQQPTKVSEVLEEAPPYMRKL